MARPRSTDPSAETIMVAAARVSSTRPTLPGTIDGSNPLSTIAAGTCGRSTFAAMARNADATMAS